VLRTLTVIAWSVALTGDAFAFQIETPVTSGCHEQITIEAIRLAGFPDLANAPAPTEDQRRARSDLTFTLPAEDDVWTMTLLVGLRSNDIRDLQLVDVAELLHIHDDPEDQPAHCIRRRDDDYEDGDLGALGACRGFILDELAQAGLFADSVDLAASERVSMYLAFRHQVELDVPRFAYHLGRAVHALEDGFAHSMRNPDDGSVRHVTNWIDYATSLNYSPARDGYQHFSTVDNCRRETAVERHHVDRAREAVRDLLAALGDPSGDGAARRARVEAALDRAFTREPGCVYENGYCNAEEIAELPTGGCTAGGGAEAGSALLVLLLLGCRRRSRVAGICMLGLVAATPARADAPSLMEQQLHAHDVWHLDMRFGAALDHAALALVAGAARDVGPWSFGGAIESNPWFSLDTERAHAGAINVYATVTRRWYDGLALAIYSRAEIGTSTILFELVGVDKYKTGVYVGGVLLGAAIKKSDRLRVTIDPSHFAMPTPQLGSLPFYYRQYRITVGVEYRFE
jgi:hypothetical protein